MEKIDLIKNIDFEALANDIHQNACKHGWHEQKHDVSHFVMMIVSELGECVNAERKGKYADRLMFEKNFDTPQINPEGHWKFCFETFIKDTVEDELADSVIRMLDLAKDQDFNIEYSDDEFKDVMDKKDGFEELPMFTSKIFVLVLALTYGSNLRLAILLSFVLAQHLGIDLLWYIEQKMKYNEMRPYKHGGKKY